MHRNWSVPALTCTDLHDNGWSAWINSGAHPKQCFQPTRRQRQNCFFKKKESPYFFKVSLTASISFYENGLLSVALSSTSWRNDVPTHCWSTKQTVWRHLQTQNFAELSAATCQEICDVLQWLGVYVKKDRSVLIVIALHEVVKEDVPSPKDDLGRSCNVQSLVSSQNNGHVYKRSGNDASLFTSRFVLYMAKAYACQKKKRFSGRKDECFERKLKLFDERCIQNGVVDADKPKAFSMMPSNRALHYYFWLPSGKTSQLRETM